MASRSAMMKPYVWIVIAIAVTVMTVLAVRVVTPIHLDDVSPAIACDPSLLREADVLYLIPLYQNRSIAEFPAWCASVAHLNKTLGMHGVRHTFKEFDRDRDRLYVREGVRAFEQCFGHLPTRFKPPQLAISASNHDLIQREFNMTIDGFVTMRFHKSYHCDEAGVFPNWVARLL